MSITNPITAMFTRRDNVVDWRSCLDLDSPNVRMVEVSPTHVSLGLDPDVWFTAAKAIAENWARMGIRWRRSRSGSPRAESNCRTR